MPTGMSYTGIFKNILVEFIGLENPILVMLEWTAQLMMQIEVEAKVGQRKENIAESGKHIFQGPG
jgi:hypothetical protein